MRFSDTTQFRIPQPIKYANSVSSPFNSKKTRSLITDTSSVSSSSIISRPPISEISTTSRSQTFLNNTALVHIPNPKSVERYVNYKQPTAIKTVRLQPQLNLVHILDKEYTQLPPLQLPSDISTTSSKLYPPLKPTNFRLHTITRIYKLTFRPTPQIQPS